MSQFLRRWRAATSVARRGVKRARLRRRLSRNDRRLSSRPGETRVDFVGSEVVPTRILPAKIAELTDPWEYQRQLENKVKSFLDVLEIPYIQLPHVSGGPQKLALRDSDWTPMLSAVSEISWVRLVGALRSPGQKLAEAELHSVSNALSLVEAKCVAFLSPAATISARKIIKRYGLESAVVLEKWDECEGGSWEAPFWNPITDNLPNDAWTEVGSHNFGEDAPLTVPHLFENSFDIDVVFTWVDGTDPLWVHRKRKAVEDITHEALTENAAADLRFIDHDELRYSLRSIEQYAPWVRHIWIVTDKQVPSWLNLEHPRVSIIDHTDIAPESTALPTFNSHAIEANLHRINGLAEHFLYFNDDMFLSSFVSPEVFFSANGIAHVFLSRARVAPGPPTVGEIASDSAGKNARKMLVDAFGKRLGRKLFHAPYALKRSVSYEIEERWPEHVDATRNAQLRTIEDITLAGSLHLNYAFAAGHAVGRAIRYRYVNIGTADAEEKLERLFKDRFRLQTFCLNEADEEIAPDVIDANVRAFLKRRYPDQSTFELEGR